MEIHELLVTPFQQNCRVLIEPSKESCVVIDPGGEVDRIYDVVKQSGTELEAIWLTHSHIDHAAGVSALEAKVEKEQGRKPTLVGHKAEEKMRSSIMAQAEMFGLDPSEYQNVREPDEYVDEGDVIEFGSLKAEVRFAPGHSPGHVVFFFADVGERPVLIAGDTLFASSIGRTDLPGGDYQTLMRSLEEQIFTLPDTTIVLSGHGPNTTIGNERSSNPFVAQLFQE